MRLSAPELLRVVIPAALILCVAVGCTRRRAKPPGDAPPIQNTADVPTPPLPGPTRLAPLAGGVGGPDFSAVFERVTPGVVSIAAGKNNKAGHFRMERSGTGLAWDATHVVTNDHLIGDASEIRVRTYDGRVLPGRLLASDGLTDVAVLAVQNSGLTVPPRGSAAELRPGQWVAAIGNPLGMNHSITVGVVSALERRKLPGAPRYGAFVQTDLNINPGNSGGPLVDDRGRVVGINTLILAGAAGVSFATPIEQVGTVVDSLLREGRFRRGFAGLFVKSVTSKAAREARLPSTAGARVTGVVATGPAAAAGLKPGDIILWYGENEIADSHALPWLIATTRPGAAVKIEAARGSERLTLALKVVAAE